MFPAYPRKNGNSDPAFFAASAKSDPISILIGKVGSESAAQSNETREAQCDPKGMTAKSERGSHASPFQQYPNSPCPEINRDSITTPGKNQNHLTLVMQPKCHILTILHTAFK
jgi:hypothetical protein